MRRRPRACAARTLPPTGRKRRHDRRPGAMRCASTPWPGAAGSEAQLLRGQARALDPGLDLAERHVAGVVGRAVVGLLVDRERREAAVVGGAELLLGDEVRRPDQLSAISCGDSDPRVLRVDHADVGHLRDAVGVGAQVLADGLDTGSLSRSDGELDQEVAGVDVEHRAEQVVVGHVRGVHGVAVAAGAGVDADVARAPRR